MRVLIKITYCYIHTTINRESSRAKKILSARHMWLAGLQLDHAGVEDEDK